MASTVEDIAVQAEGSAPPPPVTSLGAALSAATLLAACGGGQAGLDDPLARRAEAGSQRRILGLGDGAAPPDTTQIPTATQLMDWA